MGELLHEIGRKFVYYVKEKLEKTNRFNIPFIVYEANSDQTSVIKINGNKKIFDLKGAYKSLNDENLNVFIEIKDYSYQGKLNQYYKHFLKDCFSVWVKNRLYSKSWKARFLFISSHPFNCSKFSRLKNLDFLRETLKDDRNLLKYFKQFKDVIKSSFLNYVDIIFLTPIMNLIIG